MNEFALCIRGANYKLILLATMPKCNATEESLTVRTNIVQKFIHNLVQFQTNLVGY